jgi:hypothetical protein
MKTKRRGACMSWGIWNQRSDGIEEVHVHRQRGVHLAGGLVAYGVNRVLDRSIYRAIAVPFPIRRAAPISLPWLFRLSGWAHQFLNDKVAGLVIASGTNRP